VPEPSITDWISALSTAALGVLGFFVTVWQWRRSGYRPRLSARIDGKREAIELMIVNSGRAGGIIDTIEVVRPDDEVVEDATYEGFRDGAFRPLALPAMASMRIIVQAPSDRSFPEGVQLLVGVGDGQPRNVPLKHTAPNVGLFGLASILPPGSDSWPAR
jgi:hypothetical protein